MIRQKQITAVNTPPVAGISNGLRAFSKRTQRRESGILVKPLRHLHAQTQRQLRRNLPARKRPQFLPHRLPLLELFPANFAEGQVVANRLPCFQRAQVVQVIREMIPNFYAALKHVPCPHSPPAFGGATPGLATTGISRFPQPNPAPARSLRKAAPRFRATPQRSGTAAPSSPELA